MPKLKNQESKNMESKMLSSEQWILEYLENNEHPSQVESKLEEALREIERIKKELYDVRAGKF